MDRTLTVSGAGVAAGTPDAMRLSLAVVEHAGSIADALSGVASGVSALGEVARRYTGDDQISSVGLHVWPRHDNAGRQTGYEARHTLSVYCMGLDRAGDLVAELGSLEDRVLIEGVEPVIADPAPLAVLARERAWADAKAKADELAALAGTSVGEVVAIREGGASHEPVDVRLMAKAEGMPFEAGSGSVTATMTVTWALV